MKKEKYRYGSSIAKVFDAVENLECGQFKQLKVFIPNHILRTYLSKISIKEGIKFKTWTDDKGNLYVERVEF